MNKFAQTLKWIDEGEFNLSQLVSILILIFSKININSISGMARSEGRNQPSGIRKSKRYTKIKAGDATLCVAGLEESKLPV